MSTYRDDLEAAQARASAVEEENRRLREQVQRLKRKRAAEAPEVPIPERFHVVKRTNELTISWRWFRLQFVFLLFFVIAWDAFLLFWYFGPMAGMGGLLFTIFPIAHVGVGIGLTYWVLTGFCNRTVITATKGTLRVKHGPLPWRGNRVIPIDQLEQLYVTVVEHRNTNENTTRITHTYDLCALLDSKREVKLVRRLDEKGQALYLERALEEHLGIDDRFVSGAVS